MMQLGGAIGVAAIGVVFFGLLGGGADRHSADVTPQLRTSLSAAQVSGTQQDQLVAGFAQCFHDRFATTDITATPATCRLQVAAAQPAVAGALAAAGRDATAANFGSAMEDALWFQVAAFSLTGLLMLALPDRLSGEHQA